MEPEPEKTDKTWRLRLYTAGESSKYMSALASLQEICNEYLGDDCSIEVIDLLEKPHLAQEHQIVAVPTVVRERPLPVRKIIGDISQKPLVVKGLGLPPKTEGRPGARIV